MGPHTIDRRGGTNHSPPPASGDSDDRIDMARRNFENDPADVRAADPRELRARAMRIGEIGADLALGRNAGPPGSRRVSTSQTHFVASCVLESTAFLDAFMPLRVC